MAEQPTVLIEAGDQVAVITVNRPEQRNAVNTAARRELLAAFAAIEADDTVQVVVLAGAGQTFVAGADVTEFAGRSPLEQVRASQLLPVFSALDALSKPAIAAIDGYCLGGGCELAMACDIRIASDRARFGQPEIMLGILPGGGGTQRLPRLIGAGAAYKMLYLGEMITAAEAHRLGLVDEVVAPDALLARARALAAAIAKKSPIALRLIKQAVRASMRVSLDDGLRLESALLGLAFSSADKTEGISAFLEKREPRFSGK
jgi:enoyl-CoA hydratase